MYSESGSGGRYCICAGQTSYPKLDSVSQCVFTRRTFLPNFIPIRFETTEP